MYEQGAIIKFTPFYFEDGSSKDKYFVVLKLTDDGESLLASLPTRRDNVPKKDEVKEGCVELPGISFNCFVFAPNVEVTDCGKCFDFKTHLYGHALKNYEMKHLNSFYQVEGADYEIWGKMKKDYFEKLYECFRTSRNVKMKFKRFLNS